MNLKLTRSNSRIGTLPVKMLDWLRLAQLAAYWRRRQSFLQRTVKYTLYIQASSVVIMMSAPRADTLAVWASSWGYRTCPHLRPSRSDPNCWIFRAFFPSITFQQDFRPESYGDLRSCRIRVLHISGISSNSAICKRSPGQGSFAFAVVRKSRISAGFPALLYCRRTVKNCVLDLDLVLATS
eukprot:COSAG01_NODE_2188_length_8194_cov_481.771093_9_plen_182_part_00